MTRRMRFISVGLVTALLLAGSFLALVSAAPTAQESKGPQIRSCDTGRQKSANPSTLYVGEEAQVTSVLTGTCFPYDLPIDLVLLVDQSNSMTLGEPSSGVGTPQSGTAGPGPIVGTAPAPVVPPGPQTPLPPRPTQDPGPIPTALGGPGWGSGQQPDGNGGIQQPGPIVPTPTLRPLPGTGTPGHPTPPSGPGPVIPTGQATDASLVRDQTEAPGTEDLIRDVQDAIRSFLGDVEGDVKAGKVRVSLVGFNDRAYELVPLTDDVARVTSRLARIRGGGNTRVDLGLSAANRVLVGVGVRGRSDLDYRKVVILFSDGKFDKRITARMRTRSQLDVITVAAGSSADRATMRQIATSPHYALELRDRKGLVTLFQRIAPKQRNVTMKTVTIEDVLAPNMLLVTDSANPPPNRMPDARTLQWDFAPPAFPVTLTYRVRPQEAGQHPVSEKAHANWTDSEGRVGSMLFPTVTLQVMALPTPTPTSTPTATPTGTLPPTATFTPTLVPTPVPGAVYLPIVRRDPPPVPTKPCEPSQQTVDVALVIDTSTSMNDPTQPGGKAKLQAAIEAGQALVSLLKADDQTAVIGFNIAPTMATVLTSDKVRVNQALQGLPASQEKGTLIDLGLKAALEELVSSRHKSEHHRSIVLVTDGRHTGVGAEGNDAVRAVAQQIKDLSITLVTVGLGTDVDSALLQEIATKPDYYYPVPNADDLLDLYREIALFIPCP
jgi:Mg-chelatase subunit ChlD